MVIVDYKNTRNTVIEFQDKYKYRTKITYDRFIKGEISNPYDKTMYGIGYLGVGSYKSSKNHQSSKVYTTWHSMFARCYNKKYHINRPTYTNCEVCNEWHNYQNFGKWYEENYYEVQNEQMCLDKDILVNGNKLYSPNTCVFVPKRINSFFNINTLSKSESKGVGYLKKRNKYIVQCKNFIGENKYKYFDSYEDAIREYRESKNNTIDDIATYYENKIPQAIIERIRILKYWGVILS